MAVSVRAMAAALGVSKSQVARDSLAGMPMDTPEAARAWRQATHDLSRTVEGRIDRAAPASPMPADGMTSLEDQAPARPDDPPTPDDADTAAYRAARAQRERINAERAQLELDQLRGELIRLSEANRIAFTVFRALRDGGLNIPARLKNQLAAMADADAIETVLHDEISALFAGVDEASVMNDIDDEGDEAG